MFNLSEIVKISCHYEPFTIAIFRELMCTPNIIHVAARRKP